MTRQLDLDAYAPEALEVQLGGERYRFRVLSLQDCLYLMAKAGGVDGADPDPQVIADLLNRVLDLLVDQDEREAFESLDLPRQMVLLKFLVSAAREAASVFEGQSKKKPTSRRPRARRRKPR